MQNAAPSFSRVIVMVVFALSCFGLLLFLWLSFGGPIPLKPKGYRVQVAFPEATQLGLEADVRVAGVSVGKVRKKELDPSVQPHARRHRARPQVRAAPVRRAGDPAPEDAARRDLRRADAGLLEEDGPRGRPAPERPGQPTVELDEIFHALDPTTRAAFRTWQQDLAKGIDGRGQDFNDALGTLPGFAADGADVLARARQRRRARSRLVKNTGVVFGALTENEQQLANLITSAGRVFDATASQQDDLAETIRIFPTFLDESKATLARLETFSVEHPAADPRPAPGRARPPADAARRARARARPAARLPRPRPADQGRRTGLPAGSEVSAGSSRRWPSWRRSSGSSTRSCSTSRRTRSRSPTSSPTAPPRSPTRRRRRAAASATTCARSARRAWRRPRSTASGCRATAATPTRPRSRCSATSRARSSSPTTTASRPAARTRRPRATRAAARRAARSSRAELQGTSRTSRATSYGAGSK